MNTGGVWELELWADGRVLIGGAFTQVEGLPRARVALLESNGTVDVSFDPGEGPNDQVYVVKSEADGNILIGGRFTRVNGTGRNRLARLTPTGLLEASLVNGGGFNHYVHALGLEADGKIVVGGRFTTYNGQAHGRIVRLLPGGAVDPSFLVGTGANETVRTVLVQPDGHIVVGGEFTQFNGLAHYRLVCLYGG